MSWEQRRNLADLVARLSVEEKVGQLNAPLLFPPEITKERGYDSPSTIDEFEVMVRDGARRRVGPAGGMFQLATHVTGGPREVALAHNRLQKAAAETEAGIPLLQVAEGCHGVMAPGATVFPEGLALGSSWDVGLVERVYSAVAAEARSMGIHAIATLVVEPIRDPRLGRNCEGYSEDSYQVGRYAAAILAGAQGDRLDAADKVGVIFCHYPTQSEPVSGLERGAMEISERTLRDVHLRPWEIILGPGKAAGVMATYAAIDGVPAHASDWLLSTVLRDEFGFDGVVLSEGFGFRTLLYEGIVATQKEAGQLSIAAGVDVNITFEEAYLDSLIESVEEGTVDIAHIDRAAQRVLELKERLGLTAETALVDPDAAARIVHSAEHVDLALEAAESGIVLLKNEGGLLPLSKTPGRVAVLGPNADSTINLLGDYTIGSYAFGDSSGLPPVVTVLDGIRGILGPDAEIDHVRGCNVQGDDTSGIPAAVAAAAAADVAIVVVGEQQGLFWGGDPDSHTTVGEGADVASLDLSGPQELLIREVQATGTPVVVVLANGRPLSTPWVSENVAAILEAWQPGERGGEAIARLLFGDAEPSGRLPISVPRHVGQLPVYYNHRRSKHFEHHTGEGGYVDIDARPLYPFGYGLSYTTFAYENLRLSRDRVEPGGSVTASVDVVNVGDRPGVETVQLYLSDVLASVSPRIRELRGFERLLLEPGQRATAHFELDGDSMRMLNRNLEWVVEPGEFEVQIGASSDDIRCVASFEVVA